MVGPAVKDFQQLLIFWARGLVPASWMAPETKPNLQEQASMYEIGDRGTIAGMKLQLWGTDGSEGKYGEHMHLMRGGWAAVVIKTNLWAPSVAYSHVW